MMKKDLTPYLTIAEAFARLLHPLAEVVIHDLKEDQIFAIFNSFSQREVGDASYLERLDFNLDCQENIVGPYEKLNYDGKKLKSISIVLRKNHQAIGLLCINMDISAFEKHQALIHQLVTISSPSISTEQEKLFKDDLYEKINLFVQTYCRNHQLRIDNLKKEEKQDLILQLKQEGALKGKNATNYIAKIINISRATVYNYLKETAV